MTIAIQKSKTLAEFQQEFHALFTFLKVEFFTRPHDRGEGSWSKFMIFDRHKHLQEVGDIQEEGVFEFSPTMTVGDFEQEMWSKYKLSVQVFRKSMGAWLETTTSDSWSLLHQNRRGEEASLYTPEMIYIERTNDASMD